MSKVRLNLKPLRALGAKLTEVGKLRAQVGIFDNADVRTPTKPYHTETSNATLGAIHEYGWASYSFLFHKMVLTPRRSFLEAPLRLKLGDEIRRTAASWWHLILNDSPEQFMEALGELGYSIVDEAFATRGYGQWPEITSLTAELKGSDAILIESGQLRDSISYRTV